MRNFYDKLPPNIRIRLRSLVPGELRRWYAHRRTDVYLISYPKCGRTWLRLMLGRAIMRHFSLPQDDAIMFLRWRSKPHALLPMITVVHEDRPMLKAPEELQRSKEKYRYMKVIFLARDPRDVIVSSYFEMKKRGDLFGDNPYETRKPIFVGELTEFIDRKEGGFDTILEYYNIWAENRHLPEGFLLVRYEDIKRNPQRELHRVLEFLELNMVDEDTIREAIEYASFENMRKMELEGVVQDGMLRPADSSDRDSYKTRKGQVGGYKDYLSDDEIHRLDNKMQNGLSDYFGYTTS